nr:hypothetical protein [Tanacetum cinerariifolium]
DVPVVEPNQHDDVPVVHGSVLVDEDEEPKEDEFEEEDPQEEEDDMEASRSRRPRGRKMAHALVEKKGKEKDKYY